MATGDPSTTVRAALVQTEWTGAGEMLGDEGLSSLPDGVAAAGARSVSGVEVALLSLGRGLVNIPGGLQIRHRIHGASVEMHLVVEMHARTTPG